MSYSDIRFGSPSLHARSTRKNSRLNSGEHIARLDADDIGNTVRDTVSKLVRGTFAESDSARIADNLLKTIGAFGKGLHPSDCLDAFHKAFVKSWASYSHDFGTSFAGYAGYGLKQTLRNAKRKFRKLGIIGVENRSETKGIVAAIDNLNEKVNRVAVDYHHDSDLESKIMSRLDAEGIGEIVRLSRTLKGNRVAKELGITPAKVCLSLQKAARIVREMAID